MAYLWIKSFHLIAVIAWFAGLFYLPRLFVYHAMSTDQISKDRFKIMERKLYLGIMTPAGLTATLLGVWMIWLNPVLLHAGWLHAKLCMIAALWVYHIYLNYLRHQFALNQNQHDHVFYRWINEIPTLVLLIVVPLTIIKPF